MVSPGGTVFTSPPSSGDVPSTDRGAQATLRLNVGNANVIAQAPRDRIALVRLDAAQAGLCVPLNERELRIGRNPRCELVLDDEGISRKHARIYAGGETQYVEDLGSSNGTYVNGTRIRCAELTDGSLIQLGPRVQFRFARVDAHQERILRRLYEGSVRDALTGTYNRAYFQERLKAHVASAVRQGTDVSVLIIDLDHFKRVNDAYGHLAGDIVLRSAASVLRKALRREDVFARYGGEEFVVLLRGVNVEIASSVAERLRQSALRASVSFEGRFIEVTVSIGCAALSCCPEPTPEELIAVADRRLYAAKRGGRNRVVATG